MTDAVAAGGLTDRDLYLFNEGTHHRLWERFGAHLAESGGAEGVRFAVWAPNAERVAVVGSFNDWDEEADLLRMRDSSGIWEGFVRGAGRGDLYKYRIHSREAGYVVDKADPVGFRHETPPRTASVVWDLDHDWADGAWMRDRGGRLGQDAPVSVYEVHLGSWRRVPEEGGRSPGYREIAPLLADHVERMGFTHVELLPVMEHPFYGSWGYQTTGYFAPTSRWGSPQDFMALIDHLHQRGIGVILDWVPSHFPADEHGLGFFDGTYLYEHADPRRRIHPDWDSLIFNYGRHEVRSFLLSSAMFWLDVYHADGLRVDAVASMLYLDYSREDGEWTPNLEGGREDLEAIDFLRRLNTAVYGARPAVQTIAEESTAFPGVSRPVHEGGLGFGYKWDMGWMHDTLAYLARDPVHRKYHHDELTFRSLYAFSENFVLPLSHDEVVHGKRSLLDRMPGDPWRKFANLRLLFGWMFAQPGKKLLFMGSELAPWVEWSHEGSLDWDLLDEGAHGGVRRWVESLNRLYRERPALHALDCEPDGFEWIDGGDRENSVVSFLRRGGSGTGPVLVAANFTPVPREAYRVGVPDGGSWRVVADSDAAEFGGSGTGSAGVIGAEPIQRHGRDQSLSLDLPPLGILFLDREDA
ncbi:MAG: 1,4-alpha-glucan branching protein GlgB [Candidatus Palauibacterales bacterium]|nr:1,4-alpha-glucan branching protein GlgB [Candidatus Palauibacterales bacterium]MDP2530567.1 1,4-alpha-glucan branching protein GlgB [Candidatus Palauibacterales bacterium]MDP2582874.1 1,4-alpha-glucan branching protein GlgB [Candidatus Palauibacterales bacterium]